MNNDLCLLIRQVRMPVRIQAPKQKTTPVFHRKAYTIPEKIYSDREIMELYCKKFIQVPIPEDAYMAIIAKDDFINCKLILKIRTLNAN